MEEEVLAADLLTLGGRYVLEIASQMVLSFDSSFLGVDDAVVPHLRVSSFLLVVKLGAREVDGNTLVVPGGL